MATNFLLTTKQVEGLTSLSKASSTSRMRSGFAARAARAASIRDTTKAASAGSSDIVAGVAPCAKREREPRKKAPTRAQEVFLFIELKGWMRATGKECTLGVIL